MKKLLIVGLVLAAMLLLGVMIVKATAPEVVWRCYVEPVVYEEDGYWVVECGSGNEIMMTEDGGQGTEEAYPGPGVEPYPEPEPDPPGCIRAWDGEECWPSE